MADSVVASAREFLLELNRVWQSGDLEALAAFYHPDVVLLPPDLGEPICGRDAVVASYLDFLQAATLHRFETLELDVFPFQMRSEQTTCMAHLIFAVTYSLGDETFVEKGMEAYTLCREGSEGTGFQILWRHQTVLDSRIEEKS